VTVRTTIIEFQPNTDGRKAAEILSGMRAIGAIETWAYSDTDNRFAIRLSDGQSYDCAARDVIWMGRGVLAVMAHAIDVLEVGADAEQG